MYHEEEEHGLLDINGEHKRSMCSVKYFTLIAGAILLVILVLVLIASIIIVFFVNKQNVKLSSNVEISNIVDHLRVLEKIAYDHPSKSRSVVNAFNASLDYVAKTLSENTKCKLSRQNFFVPVYDQIAVPSISYTLPFQYALQHGVDFQQLRYGGNGDVTIEAPVDLLNSTGCSIDDFANSRNKIVLLEMKSTDCELIYKALNAEKSGVKSILFYNSYARKSLAMNRVRFTNWTYESPQWSQISNISTFSISYSFGKTLLSLPSTILKIVSNTRVQVVPTQNLICDVGEGTDVLFAGSHLDSVPEGPGINDNGSGSSSLLEIAIQYFKMGIVPKQRVRFAWWGAEEIGLLGARHYVRELANRDAVELNKIAIYLNFDMLGSPNFILGVHDGVTSLNPSTRTTSKKITGVFEEFFNKTIIPFARTDMVAGSDFVPFMDASIATGGLEAGASVLKTMQERTKFGGFANAAHDPCYHQFCDTVENINLDALEIHAKAAAYVVHTLSIKDDLRAFLKQ
jgi:hypothetical protein